MSASPESVPKVIVRYTARCNFTADEDAISFLKAAAAPIPAAALSPPPATPSSSSSPVAFEVQSLLKLIFPGDDTTMREFLEGTDWREKRESTIELPWSTDGLPPSGHSSHLTSWVLTSGDCGDNEATWEEEEKEPKGEEEEKEAKVEEEEKEATVEEEEKEATVEEEEKEPNGEEEEKEATVEEEEKEAKVEEEEKEPKGEEEEWTCPICLEICEPDGTWKQEMPCCPQDMETRDILTTSTG
ncbi:unnamed protein product [Cuscuta campestris]|uniref:Uncharacterized protein n=1 Tax=Cuscuta campestris TaxID=132261 RepID=A0A484NE97_9ASTE|nr:unnamed protein product [Cuscuta campestris]